ncbi:MAG: HlyD family efflux transporter periplasmic adaptor subunit [Saprospiraceae bacterium]|nr:HlyD family efflux transporter periplasmic adaptor subunit [Saprospiraceae bacterium]
MLHLAMKWLQNSTWLQHHLYMLTCCLFVLSCQERTDGIKPDISVLTESVYASVVVQPDSLYDVYASTQGLIERIFVEEGDDVIKGQLIAQVSSADPILRLEDVNLSLDLAEENLKGKANALTNMREEINLLQQQLLLDSLNYYRQNNLWKQGIGAKYELESKSLKYQSTRNQLSAARRNYEQMSLELENIYDKSKTALKMAKANLVDYDVSSLLSGRVYSLYKSAGEVISSQQPLVQIGSRDSFILEMMVDEVDIAAIEVGQSVLITLDAYKDTVFTAQVSRIYPKKNDLTQTFLIEGRFKSLPSKLYAGLSGEANIILQIRDQVLTIPIEYLSEDNQVMTKAGEITVQVGLRGFDKVEIISGIDSLTEIFKP